MPQHGLLLSNLLACSCGNDRFVRSRSGPPRSYFHQFFPLTLHSSILFDFSRRRPRRAPPRKRSFHFPVHSVIPLSSVRDRTTRSYKLGIFHVIWSRRPSPLPLGVFFFFFHELPLFAPERMNTSFPLTLNVWAVALDFESHPFVFFESASLPPSLLLSSPCRLFSGPPFLPCWPPTMAVLFFPCLLLGFSQIKFMVTRLTDLACEDPDSVFPLHSPVSGHRRARIGPRVAWRRWWAPFFFFAALDPKSPDFFYLFFLLVLDQNLLLSPPELDSLWE